MEIKEKLLESFVVTLLIGSIALFVLALSHLLTGSGTLFVKEIVILITTGAFTSQLVSLGISERIKRLNNFDKKSI